MNKYFFQKERKQLFQKVQNQKQLLLKEGGKKKENQTLQLQSSSTQTSSQQQHSNQQKKAHLKDDYLNRKIKHSDFKKKDLELIQMPKETLDKIYKSTLKVRLNQNLLGNTITTFQNRLKSCQSALSNYSKGSRNS